MENESVTKSEKKVEQKEDPFARLRGHLKQAQRGTLVKKSLFLVLDRSGSMASPCENGTPKYTAVRKVVDDVISEYTTKVRISTVAFDSSADILQDLNDYRPIGGTNIEEGLRLIEPGSQAVLLSDGDETDGRAMRAVEVLVRDKTVVHCIGVGVEGLGEQLLKDIAAQTGGFYAGIDANFSQIFETFKKLASKAVAALTAGDTNGQSGSNSIRLGS